MKHSNPNRNKIGDRHLCNSLPVCVLQADQPGRRVMKIRMPDGGDDLVNIHGAVGVILDGPGVHAADGGDAAVLVDVDVRVVAEDGLAAPDVAVHEHGDEVAHGARRHEERGLLAHDRGHLRLEALRGRVGAQDVVVDDGGGHGGPHRLGGLGHRVRPEVHHLARHLAGAARTEPLATLQLPPGLHCSGATESSPNKLHTPKLTNELDAQPPRFVFEIWFAFSLKIGNFFALLEVIPV